MPALTPFAFGENWTRFLATVDEDRITSAMRSLRSLFGVESFAGLRFLDGGSGSGLFSLAASRLGASVVSFDIDPHSVACTSQMKRRYAAEDTHWEIHTGSLLDAAFLERLGTFDLVYSWGVVHHTGQMWPAIDLLQHRVAQNGRICLAVYNDQGRVSTIWSAIKRVYNALPGFLQTPYVIVIGGPWGLWRLTTRSVAIAAAAIARPLLPKNSQPSPPRLFASQSRRGMHWWYDLVDWIGGWPFEVAKSEDVLHFMSQRGFTLTELTTCGGSLGCNEFVFHRSTKSSE